MKKIKLHPLFLLLAAIFVFSGKWQQLAASFAAVVLHECSHFLTARARGYRLFDLTVMPFGALLSTDENILPSDEAIIIWAGPFSNFCTAIGVMALWWAAPSSYAYTLEFFRANVVIGAFNLLPAYPLDGARLLLSMSKNRHKMIKAGRVFGMVVSVLLMAGFIVSGFFTINYTLGLASVTLFVGSVSDIKKERYIHVCRQLAYLKDLSRPLEKKRYAVHENLPIKQIMKILKPQAVYEIEIIDNTMKTLAVLNESQLEQLLMRQKNMTAGQACKRYMQGIEFVDK
jgi:stage IV sporulation protein FB